MFTIGWPLRSAIAAGSRDSHIVKKFRDRFYCWTLLLSFWASLLCALHGMAWVRVGDFVGNNVATQVTLL
jgi:hypothetical protein